MSNIDEDNASQYADRKFCQTIALTHILCGGGGAVLRQYSDDIQDNVVWLLSDLIRECELASIKAMEQMAAEHKAELEMLKGAK